MFNLSEIRTDFPQISRLVDGQKMIYLDSAATALKPKSVIDAVSEYYSRSVANIHRGAHFLGNEGTMRYEAVRDQVKHFLGAESSEEIVFTRGTTEGINLVAQTLAHSQLNPGDEILLTEMEHHSNIVPWQLVAKEKGLLIRFARVTEVGEIDLRDFKDQLNEKTKVVALTHCSNALGVVNPVSELCKWAKSAGALTLIDAAQSATFGPLDVKDIGCDFLVFSGHKVFGPTGIGVLYGRRPILENLPPYQGGGSMISEVSVAESTFLPPPHRFEAGTQHIAGVIGLGAALSYLEKFTKHEMAGYKRQLLSQAIDGLSSMDGIQWIGQSETRVSIASFIIEGVHPSDLGQLMDQQGVAVRAGHHCCQPLMARFGIPGTVRISTAIYNSAADVDQMIRAVHKARSLLS